MRIWSLHPHYLDPQGLVALWRETLLALAVLRGETQGYRHHPQLHRFQAQSDPIAAIQTYLYHIFREAESRGYHFNPSKVGATGEVNPISVSDGQLAYEWEHLLRKLHTRNPKVYRQWYKVTMPEPHPLFVIKPGPVESWERQLHKD